ncbi:MAG: RIO1 family regulatory kinase/ATPase [Candidatus Thorarchaeota archaeon]
MNLNQKDFRILGAIERLMITQKYPRTIDLPRETGYSFSYLQKRIEILHKYNLIETKRKEGEYYEVALKYDGYDALAFNALVKNGTISGIGQQIGVGKESEVYLINNDSNKLGILKIHRLGKTKYKSYKKTRNYLAEKHHSSRMYNSRLAASNEADILKQTENLIPVPKIWSHNRHCVVMDYIDGVELFKLKKIELTIFRQLYEEIMRIITVLARNGIIHADFSPYNILITINQEKNNFKPYIIDWPQAVNIKHPNARDFLINDLFNIFTFFGKRIPVPIDSLNEIVNDLMK